MNRSQLIVQLKSHRLVPPPKRRPLNREQRDTRSSLTREEETSVAEEGEGSTELVPATPSPRSTKPTGKNLAAMRREMSAESGQDLQTPKSVAFKESLYGREHGSTRVWGGKGKGKHGRKRSKPKKDTRPLEEREGWQDPEVLRALRSEPNNVWRMPVRPSMGRKLE